MDDKDYTSALGATNMEDIGEPLSAGGFIIRDEHDEGYYNLIEDEIVCQINTRSARRS